MKKAVFLQCVRDARNISAIPQEEKNTALEVFSGCYFHKNRVMATREQFCYVLNYQAMQFNGTWDMPELEKMATVAQRVDLL